MSDRQAEAQALVQRLRSAVNALSRLDLDLAAFATVERMLLTQVTTAERASVSPPALAASVREAEIQVRVFTVLADRLAAGRVAPPAAELIALLARERGRVWSATQLGRTLGLERASDFTERTIVSMKSEGRAALADLDWIGIFNVWGRGWMLRAEHPDDARHAYAGMTISPVMPRAWIGGEQIDLTVERWRTLVALVKEPRHESELTRLIGNRALALQTIRILRPTLGRFGYTILSGPYRLLPPPAPGDDPAPPPTATG